MAGDQFPSIFNAHNALQTSELRIECSGSADVVIRVGYDMNITCHPMLQIILHISCSLMMAQLRCLELNFSVVYQSI